MTRRPDSGTHTSPRRTARFTHTSPQRIPGIYAYFPTNPIVPIIFNSYRAAGEASKRPLDHTLRPGTRSTDIHPHPYRYIGNARPETPPDQARPVLPATLRRKLLGNGIAAAGWPQLNRGEGRHQVIRAICHGKRGEIRKPYREGQEDQLSALGLVTNATVLWNTIYMQAALDHLRDEGMEIRQEDLARLSQLQHKHVNVLGRYSFALAEPIAKGELRPLHLEESGRGRSVRAPFFGRHL